MPIYDKNPEQNGERIFPHSTRRYLQIQANIILNGIKQKDFLQRSGSGNGFSLSPQFHLACKSFHSNRTRNNIKGNPRQENESHFL